MKRFYQIILALFFFTSCLNQAKVSDIEPFTPILITNITITFSGDVMQHAPQVYAAMRDSIYDYSSVFSSISSFWNSADFAVINLETTLSDTPPYSGYPLFSSPYELASDLKNAGVDIIALANNHCVDRGGEGVRKTISALEKADLKYVGLSNNNQRRSTLLLEKNNIKLSLLNYTYGTNGMPEPKNCRISLIDTAAIRSDYKQAQTEGADAVIVFFHWGYEYHTTPNDEQRSLAAWCRNLGIDFIIGSHSHVPQPIESEEYTAYSLGNLVSNQSAGYTQGGASVLLTVYSNKYIDVQYVPHWVDRANRYTILLPKDTIQNTNWQFIRSLDNTRKIIGPTVKEWKLN